MFCKNCGLEDTDSNAKFCSTCGTAFTLRKHDSTPPKFVTQTQTLTNSFVYPFNDEKYKLESLKSNIQIIAVFDLIVGVFAVLGSLLLFSVRNLIMSSNNVHIMDHHEISGAMFGANIVGFIGFLLLIYAILALVSGIGLLKGKKWARFSSMVVGGLAIFNFPIGSVFGGLSIYYLSRPGIDQALKA